MKYEPQLIEGKFLRRYKRFFADIEVQNEVVVAHVPNTGSLRGICDQPNRKSLISPATNPDRKLKFTLEQVHVGTSWVGVNTHRANDLAWEAFEKGTIPHWKKFKSGQREVKINKATRLDFAFTKENGSQHYVEVKSVTLSEVQNGKRLALFPDAVTTRGLKHIGELSTLLKQGHSVELLFVVQRSDCESFSPAKEIDPDYAKALKSAQNEGVKISAFQTELSNIGIHISDSIPVLI